MEGNLLNRLQDGLHLDNDPNDQPPNTYRDSRNGTIVAKGGNRFAWETLPGTQLSFTIPAHYSATGPGNLAAQYQPVGWCSFPDGPTLASLAPALFVLLANDDTVDPAGSEIGIVTFDNTGLGSYLPLY